MSESVPKVVLSELLNNGRLSPKQFMRARRPSLFSDSTTSTEHNLTREVLDHHLDTLTSRKQEIDFEHLCRRLAEKELCPNLLPQTGPTGGGDSKADTETYPVADEIAFRWYQGSPTDSAQDRWAFAFSAKKQWPSKVRSDVNNLAATGRYILIYFITNQYVRDKKRAEFEDELTQKHNIKVRIMDRSWILKCIFEHDRMQLAIETLRLDAPASSATTRPGPRDLRNTERLRELESRLQDTNRYTGVEYQFIEECLRAAILSRSLELPRVETEGRFLRAERAARRSGTSHQKLRIVYSWAWTAYWWFEDIAQFRDLYQQVEDLANASEDANDLEQVVNLWQLLTSACAAGTLDAVSVGLADRTSKLISSLELLTEDTSRPNNALWAKTQLLLMNIHQASQDAAGLRRLLSDFDKVLRSTDGLVEYPVETVGRVIQEIGDWISDIPEYENLLDTTVKITQRRASNREAGKLLLVRGFQKLRAGKNYDVIRLFGRAQQMLALRESRNELIEALFGCGLAYESVGLLWAARANILSAMNQTLADLRTNGNLSHQALICVRRLIWQELQLGRVAPVLEWVRLASILNFSLGPDEKDREQFKDEIAALDIGLSALIARSEIDDLNQLRYFQKS
jgi:hypothetical protein